MSDVIYGLTLHASIFHKIDKKKNFLGNESKCQKNQLENLFFYLTTSLVILA